jgi:hypothetical protein
MSELNDMLHYTERKRYSQAEADSLIAQATADALEAAALIADKHWPESGHVHQEGAISCQMSVSVEIRRLKSKLRTPDIAAKAKELRQELADCKDALYVASRQSEERDAEIRQKAYDEGVNHGISEASKTWDAEATRIRREERELFFRKLDGYSKLALSNEQHGESVGNEGLRYSRSVVRQYLRDIEKELRAEWANEADGGG